MSRWKTLLAGGVKANVVPSKAVIVVAPGAVEEVTKVKACA
jgi:hypothetical protein